MSSDTKQHLIDIGKSIFARGSYEGLSMRTLAQSAGVASSVTYHHFKDKDVLLKSIFDSTNTKLGIERAALKKPKSTLEALTQRVNFQFDHAEDVVFVLKYYLHFRPTFAKLKNGYVPAKAYLHIEEVLKLGLEAGELDPNLNIEEQSKIITHAINGFVLEYFPNPPKGKERKELVDGIVTFIYRSIERRN